MLGLVPGLLGVFGIGHFLVGRFLRGLVFLIGGIVIQYLAGTVPLEMMGGAPPEAVAVSYIIGYIVVIVLYLFQAIDAYLCGRGANWIA